VKDGVGIEEAVEVVGSSLSGGITLEGEEKKRGLGIKCGIWLLYTAHY